MRQFKCHFLVVSMFLAGIFLSGCVANSGNYGRLVPDDEVKKTYENNTVDPRYNYYYYGTRTFPKAFIGISKDIELVSDFWEPIDLTPEILHNWIWLHANRYSWNVHRYGSRILTQTGKKIGVWYSLESWKQWTTIKMLPGNKVHVGTPEGGDEDRLRRRFSGFGILDF